ncbi:MAG: membrane protein insertion efficiency factor YidD [Proteobacteria bacterium]|nr:membrane protein insertion efficiency factor YidD [Pseudomonadota bacterium]
MSRFLIILLRTYRFMISPFLGNCCRFYPSCSVYSEEAIQEFGIWKGLMLTLWRLLRCQPFNPGGYDPVQKRRRS